MLPVEPSQRLQGPVEVAVGRLEVVLCDAVRCVDVREHAAHVVRERMIDKRDGALDERLLVRGAAFLVLGEEAVRVVRLETSRRDESAYISRGTYP